MLVFLILLMVTRSYSFLFGLGKVSLESEYDFIVVGGGSAGAVVANRLSEVSNWTVLLIEAGGEENIVTQIPMLVTYTIPTALNWGYRTEKSPGACLGLRDQRCIWPRGKSLGGTSILNYMVYTRGDRKDYDLWEALGNPGWGYDNVLKYFIKSEDQQNPYLARTPYHGTGGPLTVTEAPYRTPLAHAYLEAALSMGYNLRDTNGEEHSGFQFVQGTIRRGARLSTNKAFLDPDTRKRHNLYVAVRSTVTRLLMDGMHVKGVEVSRDGKLYITRARREVILSAGTFNSPQILMLSGIGPKHHLQELEIPVVQDLPVGYNLQDHVALGGLTFLVNQSVGIIESEINTLPSVLKWLKEGEGPLTVLGGVEAYGLVSSPHNLYSGIKDWPDLELVFAPGSTNSDEGLLKRVHDITDEIYNKVFLPIKGVPSFTIFPIGLRPESRGAVRLRSKNPLDAPLFYPNYFSSRRDVEVILYGTQLALQLALSPAFQKYGVRLHDIPLPGCEHIQFASLQYWECQLRTYTMLFHHQTGTCKMGPPTDPEAVVDPRLRVYGIRGLRVIDASIAPLIPSGHANAVVIMIAEKGSDLIKQDWGVI
ncbi:hypothetical protein L9F63_022610 [Diploptera punctata]|uniref:Glucose-methanol-choline oxidoreductase N-terminal domain-containing protein n=1 Tax=Diploptera punctata TaxID=6984 RepID=A0AAD8EA86_DIPPU|nr:hypothetical protein L9F63_022610 [Diploptera punctata]